MIIYIITFVVTIFMTMIAEKQFKENKKRLGLICSLIVILVPSIIAGIRDVSVGTDVRVYGEYLVKKAQTAKDFEEYLSFTNAEIGYSVLNFVVVKIFKNIHWVLFFAQLITIGNVFVFLYQKRDSISITLGMFIYLLCFYNISLNILRQSIAVSFVLCSLPFWEKKKYRNVILLFCFAIIFHSSAAIALFMYAIMWIFDNETLGIKTKRMLIFLILIIGIIIQVAYKPLIEFFTYDIQILPEKYINYILNRYNENKVLKVNKLNVLIHMFFILIFLLNSKKNKNIYSYVSFAIIGLTILFLGTVTSNFIRLGYYVSIPSLMVLASNSYTILKKDRINQNLFSFIILVIFVTYWYLEFIKYNTAQTYPYILGI